MRKLKFRDVMRFIRALKAAGVKDYIINNLAAKIDAAPTKEAAGVELLYGIVDFISEDKGEAAMYEFLSDIVGKPAEELADLGLAEGLDLIKQLAKENDLKAFFNSVLSTLKTRAA